jgi:predicted  nucleic acid-binding Zn-ribbon protein
LSGPIAGTSGAIDEKGQMQSDTQTLELRPDIIEQLESKINELQTKLDEKTDEEYLTSLISQREILNKEKSKLTEYSTLITKLQKDLKKVDVKLSEVLEDIGYEESLEISKVPPNILELVYETIIEDAINHIKHNCGVHDTELVVNRTLEEIRFRTSGSELFKYENGKLKLRNLTKYINQKSISAKQIHTTFKELLSKLIENIPDYEPKNFKAMIKIKSQEYSLDQFAGISTQFKNFETNVNNLTQQIDKITNKLRDLEVVIEASSNEIGTFKHRLKNIEATVNSLSEPIDAESDNIDSDNNESEDNESEKDNSDQTSEDESKNEQ